MQPAFLVVLCNDNSQLRSPSVRIERCPDQPYRQLGYSGGILVPQALCGAAPRQAVVLVVVPVGAPNMLADFEAVTEVIDSGLVR